MKRFYSILVPCIMLLVQTNVSGSFYGANKKISQSKNKKSNRQTKSKQNNYAGVGVEVGANLEYQRMSTDNHDFRDSPNSINVVRYGGNLSLGYTRRFCRNFYVGVAVGADISGGKNKMWSGGALNLNSEFVRQNLVRRNLLRNLLGMISARTCISTPMADIEYVPINYFNQLVNYIHYIGGASVSNPDFPRFFGAESVVFDQLGNYGASISDSPDPLLAGLNDLRNFASEQFPVASQVLGSMASEGISSQNGTNCIIGSPGDESLSQYGSEVISELLRGDPTSEKGYYCYMYLDKVSQILPADLLPDDPNHANLGLTSDQRQLDTALRAINDMYYNDDALLTPPGVDADALKNKFYAKTSFDVCPHISLQLGYYFKELNGMMYTKIGAMELNGRATIVCDTDNVHTEKFKKWAPFVAVGFNKNLTENFGFAFELAQTFKAKEKLPTIRLFNRYKIDESVTLSRTIFRATLTYRLPHSRN